MASSLLDHFYRWDETMDIPGIEGLLIPETFGKGLPDINEGMLLAGYQSHEIRYIREYAHILSITEQEAVVHLGIGTQDRMAAAVALWKGLAWLPMKEAGTVNIRSMKSYAVPPQLNEMAPRAVPLAEKPGSILYLAHLHDTYTHQAVRSMMLTVTNGITQLLEVIDKTDAGNTQLGDFLHQIGIVDQETIARCLAEQKRIAAQGSHIKFGEILRLQGMVPYPVILAALKKMGVDNTERENAASHPAQSGGPKLFWAVSTIGTVEMLYRRDLLDTWADVEKAYKSSNADKYGEMIRRLLVHAAYHGYSDIHFSPIPNAGMIEGRLDGIKDLFLMLHREDYSRLVGVIINSLGNLDMRLQAEGRIPPNILPRELAGRFEFRLQYMNTIQSDADTGSLTLRVLNLMSETGDLDTLGFAPDDLDYLKRIIRSGKGLVISTGPTGSGKTTTQYALMRDVDAIQHSVQTVENPVEIRVGIWRQHQLIREIAEHKEWASWNKGLLRNDPDVVLQGEVRNADLFVQVADMANTGHLVFTTFHASDAALAIGRIRQMRTDSGDPIDIDMISSLLHCIIAQGLARRLCPHCSVPDTREETWQAVSALKKEGNLAPTPKRAASGGCSHCSGTGYRGRFLVYEILKFNKAIRESIVAGCSLSEMAKAIPEEERMNGRLRRLLAEGKTSIEEAYRLSEDFA